MINLSAGSLRIVLDSAGKLVGLNRSENGREYAAARCESPFIRIVVEGKAEAPSSASYDGGTGTLTFAFADSGARVEVVYTSALRYAAFEATRIVGADADALVWGPYATSVADSVGESVGVVHDGDFAIGLQSLNMKTVGGWPIELVSPFDPAEAERANDRPDPNGGGHSPSDMKFPYAACTAWPLDGGSLLQAFARNRSKAARRTVWNLPDVPVAPIGGDDAGIVGTRIALFGCPAGEALDTIEAIELGEGLPHPLFEGVWGKKSPGANQSYFITDFTEATMADAVRYTKEAGLKYVYHPDPFGQWGHFALKERSFPNGDDGLRDCVRLAEGEGVRVGLHTLSNFTTLNDPYVAPVPDERLQTVGASRLVSRMEETAGDLEVDDPGPFTVRLFRQTARIGSELIEYDAVTDGAPWKLLNVKRGANGTTASAHEPGTEISRLWDHPYDVLFPSFELQDEYSARIAELFRATGVKQISFDGLEGLYATGQDDYGVSRFVRRCYDGWGEEVINDASIVVPNYLWHIFTRFNWGEPWGAATREGQLEWRLANQRYFARNFIPPMLGWFLIRTASDRFEATAPDEIEWVLSKAAGYRAGFALVADMPVLERIGNRERLLGAVRCWESARLAGAFTPEQRERLRDPKSDWHLEPADEGEWTLYPVELSKPFVCSPSELQPGQPGGADWAYYNRHAEQPLRLCLRVIPSYGSEDAAVRRPTFYIGSACLIFDTEVAANEYLVCDGDRFGRIYDRDWNLLRTVRAPADGPVVRSGGQTISFSCKFTGDPKPVVSVKIMTRGLPETVRAPGR
ncbi:hypothetical protein [Cohnella cellulosilytica]|uniref:Uncharacterized protein n=1 Tax=Cohnella cellulosilytica TaxID=986710 RepID=A0ABW2FGJ2_9BACL